VTRVYPHVVASCGTHSCVVRDSSKRTHSRQGERQVTSVYPHVDAGLVFHCSLLRPHGADSAGHGLCVYVCVFLSLSLSLLSLLSLAVCVCTHTPAHTHTHTHTHSHTHTHTCGDEALVIAEVLDPRIPGISLSPPQPFHIGNCYLPGILLLIRVLRPSLCPHHNHFIFIILIIIIIIIIIIDRQELLPADIGNYYLHEKLLLTVVNCFLRASMCPHHNLSV
jgi:hypothetical protein